MSSPWLKQSSGWVLWIFPEHQTRRISRPCNMKETKHKKKASNETRGFWISGCTKDRSPLFMHAWLSSLCPPPHPGNVHESPGIYILSFSEWAKLRRSPRLPDRQKNPPIHEIWIALHQERESKGCTAIKITQNPKILKKIPRKSRLGFLPGHRTNSTTVYIFFRA